MYNTIRTMITLIGLHDSDRRHHHHHHHHSCLSRIGPSGQFQFKTNYETICPLDFGRTLGELTHITTFTYTRHHSTERHGHISMPRAGLEPAIPAFEWYET